MSHHFHPESWATSRGGTAQVLVNDLDPQEAVRLQPVRHGVLQGAALAVVHDLMRRGLPDIEHRFAAQGAIAESW